MTKLFQDFQFLGLPWDWAHITLSYDWAWAIATICGILLIALPLLLGVAMIIYADRKIWAEMALRRGPNVVGPFGLLQSFADGLKVFLQETIVPSASNKALFLIAPVITFTVALLAWAVIPFAPGVVLADINVGLLYVLAASSIGVYGVIIAGWASNSKYAFLGALRASAQMVSYEIAMGFALVVVLMVSSSLNMTEVVLGQGKGQFAEMGVNFLSWNWLPLLPVFVVYFISGLAETNRHPFDVVEGESEIVAGHMVEHSDQKARVARRGSDRARIEARQIEESGEPVRIADDECKHLNRHAFGDFTVNGLWPCHGSRFAVPKRIPSRLAQSCLDHIVPVAMG